MKKIFATALALIAIAPAAVLAAPGAPARGLKSDLSLKWLPKATEERKGRMADIAVPGAKAQARQAEATTLETGDETGYLDAPDGSTWYYTATYDYDVIDHEAWTEKQIRGYHYKIYDNSFNLVTEIDDEVHFAEGETGVAAVQIGPAVSKKFFNYDDKYEFMVVLMLHTDKFVNNIYTLVYTQGKAEPINRIEGYYISAVNASTSSWSEDIYMTFITEEDTEQPEIGGIMNVADNVFTIYRKAGYSGMTELAKLRVPMILMSGEDALPFIAKVEDGQPWFAVNHLKYCFYEDPYDWENENATPDNELLIDLYTYQGWEGFQKVATTAIATEQIDDIPYSFYYLGNFTYEDDITFGRYADSSEPAYIITRSNYLSASDDYCHDYLVYNLKGEQLLTIGEGVTTSVFQSDVAGYDPQVMFVRGEDGDYSFEFVNMLTGEVEHVLPYYIADGITVNTTCDRIPDAGNGYLYVVSQLFADVDDQDNVLHTIGYITPEGEAHHADRLNLGKNIALAQCYIAAEALSPYIFNTDAEREYMVLVKRLESATGSRSHEELMVLNTSKTLLQMGPDEQMGDLQNIWLSVPENGSDPFLSIIYNNDYRYTMQNLALPLDGLKAGSGTAEDPYLISTVGDLEQVRNDLKAHYRLACDIHAEGYTMRPIEGEFTGVLDGAGHYISGLGIKNGGIFSDVQREDIGAATAATTGIVRDLTLLHPRFSASRDQAGIIAGSSMGGTFSNIRIYDAKVSGDKNCSILGGIVGGAVLGTVIEGCLVEANVDCRAMFGGIVGDTRTGTAVKACLFMGEVNDAWMAGGIVGEFNNSDDSVRDCHVRARITADNNVGGIVSRSNRGMIENCYFSGALNAAKADEGGEYYSEGPVIGGIVGWLEGDYSDSEEPRVCVRNNLVFIDEMKGFTPVGTPRNPNQFASMHRIVGYSVYNEGGEYLRDDAEGNPVYGEAPVEKGLSENYAFKPSQPVDKSIESKHDTTEGALILPSQLTPAFLAEHGFRTGTDIDNPWKAENAGDYMELWFEGPVLVTAATSYSVKVDDTVTAPFELFADNIVSFDNSFENTVITFSDEGIAEVASTSVSGDILYVEVKGLKSGKTTMTVEVIPGLTAQCDIIVEQTSAIDKVEVAPIAPLGYDGQRVTATGCDISIFSTAGTIVASGRDSVSVASLTSGVYIATATSADGTRRSLKLRIP